MECVINSRKTAFDIKIKISGSHDVSVFMVRAIYGKITGTNVRLKNLIHTSMTFFFTEITLRPKFVAAFTTLEIPSVSPSNSALRF